MYSAGGRRESNGATEPLLGSEAPRLSPQPPPAAHPPRRLISSISEVFRSAATAQPRLTESMDYEQVQNQVSMQYENARLSSTKRHFYG
eukprot:scaffold681841_cov69-Prasinocladus_malaysianus.AAC.1